MRYLRHADVAVLALAPPVFVILAAPIAGLLVGAGAWLAQKGIQVALERYARERGDARLMAAYSAGGAVVRAWTVAAAILVSGLVLGDEVGLAAVLVVLAAFSVYFVGKMAERYRELTDESGGGA